MEFAVEAGKLLEVSLEGQSIAALKIRTYSLYQT